jgi:hypothetical protein
VFPLVSACRAAASPLSSAPALDAFGIARFHPSRASAREWTSAHWGNGLARTIRYSGDPYDPTGWTDNHSSGGGDSLFVDGKGSLILKGAGPRFHINSTEAYAAGAPPATAPPQAFVNVEATGYARRLSTGGSAWDGMEIQVRTGPLAHASAGGNVCDATGYAARFRDDGNWDWEKELKHPDSKVYSTRAGFSAPLFPGRTLPVGKWIGMKFLAYNVDAGRVRLELYIDSVSDAGAGPPADGGHWETVGTMIDDGADFPGGDVSGCPDLVPDMAITAGHGTVLLRTDNEACEWKYLSVREIDPDVAVGLLQPPRAGFRNPASSRPFAAEAFDAAGRRFGHGGGPAGPAFDPAGAGPAKEGFPLRR